MVFSLDSKVSLNFQAATITSVITRMWWANVQRDSHPAEYRWRCVLNTAVWLAPTAHVPCSNATKIRERKTWRLQSQFCTWQNSVTGQEPLKMNIYCTSAGNG